MSASVRTRCRGGAATSRLWGPWQCQECRGAGGHRYRRYSALRIFLASGHSAPKRIEHGGGVATWIIGTLAAQGSLWPWTQEVCYSFF